MQRKIILIAFCGWDESSDLNWGTSRGKGSKSWMWFELICVASFLLLALIHHCTELARTLLLSFVLVFVSLAAQLRLTLIQCQRKKVSCLMLIFPVNCPLVILFWSFVFFSDLIATLKLERKIMRPQMKAFGVWRVFCGRWDGLCIWPDEQLWRWSFGS